MPAPRWIVAAALTAAATTAALATPVLAAPTAENSPTPELKARPDNRRDQIQRLEKAHPAINAHPVSEVLGDLNRHTRTPAECARYVPPASPSPPAPDPLPPIRSHPHPDKGFCWNSGDMATKKWVPQGITQSAQGWLVSWHNKNNSQSRITLVDNAHKTYRHIVLVDTAGSNLGPVGTHAGGIAWVGHYLYVADSGNGLRVFDLNHVWKADGGKKDSGYRVENGKVHAAGYKYALPQVGSYTAVHKPGAKNPCDKSKNPFFSSVSVDQKSNKLVSGEYCGTKNDVGRLARWSLGRDGLLDTSGGAARASDWYFTAQHTMQGVATRGDEVRATTSHKSRPGVWHSMSLAGKHNGDTLKDSGRGKRTAVRSPEDITFAGGNYWTLSEYRGARYVFPYEG